MAIPTPPREPSSDRTTLLTVVLALLMLLVGAPAAHGHTIGELTRTKGRSPDTLIGLGLVIGLDGTGDTSKDSLVAVRPFSKLLENLGNAVPDLNDLAEANAYALVMVTMEVPESGAHEGDRFDVSVDKLFNASSLSGGRLVPSLLRIPAPDSPQLRPLAFATGPLLVAADDPASARVVRGGQMLADVQHTVVGDGGVVTLVLEEQYASTQNAYTIAEAINEPLSFGNEDDRTSWTPIAFAEQDGRTIRVRVPEADRAYPAAFLAWLEGLAIDPSLIASEAIVRVNRETGTIVVSPDVEIGPVAISHRGLQVNTLGGGGGGWTGLDTTDGTSRRSTSLQGLLQALARLDVPVEDQIAILEELRAARAIRARIEGR